MSTLKADTIQSTSGGAATLTKQEAAKHWVNYDAVDGIVDGSLNQTTLQDHGAGDFTTKFTNNFSSVTDRCHFASCMNATDGGETRLAGDTRCGVNANIGHLVSDSTMTAPTTGQVDFFTGKNSDANAQGDNVDVSASYCMTIGDLL
jgi:hypothetical protein|tara:strand:+ start:3628 stop:4068 length:441 start_codon:yes stop_codon:yes gene_type:complete